MSKQSGAAQQGDREEESAASLAQTNLQLHMKPHDSIILFYKYHPLSSDWNLMELYRQALHDLCSALGLRGRILVGVSDDSEGINGTLSGCKRHVQAFTHALMGPNKIQHPEKNNEGDMQIDCALQNFWKSAQEFCRRAGAAKGKPPIPLLVMDSPQDFKWSHIDTKTTKSQHVFPDLNIKLVSEMIGTGGLFSSISIDETSQGYLTPQEWHDKLLSFQEQEKSSDGHKEGSTLLIDCRNDKECQIGRFPNSINPQTRTFGQFPQWVQNNMDKLSKASNILMYCTGGIRCEKATAYIRRQFENSDIDSQSRKQLPKVFHLKGGIHKYMEHYDSATDENITGNTSDKDSSLWKGKNFVFDARSFSSNCEGRGGVDMDGSSCGQKADSNNNTSSLSGRKVNTATSSNDGEEGTNTNIVGRCLYCPSFYDSFHPAIVCTVCREPVLVCPSCRAQRREYHCGQHLHLQSCYFTHLQHFTKEELEHQLHQLQNVHLPPLLVGKAFRQRRKTLQKQIHKVQQFLAGKQKGEKAKENGASTRCRSCGLDDCDGACWGFHGLKRKELLERQQEQEQHIAKKSKPSVDCGGKRTRPSAGHRKSKVTSRLHAIQELQQLGYAAPPWQFCHSLLESNGNQKFYVRIPPPCTRLIETNVKGKWCGKSAVHVVEQEFIHNNNNNIDDNTKTTGNDSNLLEQVQAGLLRVNSKAIGIENPVILKNMDTLGRVVHWHEPPILVPSRIHVQKVKLPLLNDANEDNDKNNSDEVLFVCDKPSTVPVHPVGPYLANSLTIMVEAQEKLSPRSLHPCHRIDRVTSGLTLCTTNDNVSRIIQGCCMKSSGGDKSGFVRKLYLAEVKGKFGSPTTSSSLAQWKLLENKSTIEVSAPIWVENPQNGIRTIHAKGKPAQSRFQLCHYDDTKQTSLVLCSPITGRGHQLRVHLQWLGYPILGDVLYGGPTLADNKCKSVPALICKSNQNSSEKRDERLSLNDVEMAKMCCQCCGGGEANVEKSFTPAQLLQEGHTIHLHAFRYEINFPDKYHNNKAGKGLTLQVPLPVWAEQLQDSSFPWL